MYVWQFYIPRQVMGSQTTLILYLAIVNDILQGRPCRRVGKINGQTGLKKKTTFFFIWYEGEKPLAMDNKNTG